MKRRHFLTATGTAAAWRPSRAAPAPQPQRLVVAAFPLVDKIVEAAMPAWQAQHPGVEVQVISKQYADHHTAMTTALSTSGSGSASMPDVMALESTYMGRFSLGQGLENLSAAPFNAERHREAFTPFAFEQARNRQGGIVALPADIGPGTLLYRKDLLDRAGLAEADLTRSWESYVDSGRKLKAATGARLIGDVKLLKDIMIRSGAAPGDGMFYDAQQRPLVTSPRFVRAFELCRQVRREGLDGGVEVWRNDWAESLKRGRLATEMSGCWMVGQLANWVAPETRGLWRSAPLPEQTYVSYGGTYYVIPRRSDPARKALAWSLIQTMTLDRQRQLDTFRAQDAFPALLAAQEDPFFDEPLPFLGGQRARLLWRDLARKIRAQAPHRQATFAQEVINGELDNVLAYGKDVRTALADAERVLALRAKR